MMKNHGLILTGADERPVFDTIMNAKKPNLDKLAKDAATAKAIILESRNHIN